MICTGGLAAGTPIYLPVESIPHLHHDEENNGQYEKGVYPPFDPAALCEIQELAPGQKVVTSYTYGSRSNPSKTKDDLVDRVVYLGMRDCVEWATEEGNTFYATEDMRFVDGDVVRSPRDMGLISLAVKKLPCYQVKLHSGQIYMLRLGLRETMKAVGPGQVNGR